MRPLFTLPLPELVISTLKRAGYHYFEDLKEEYKDSQKKILDIISSCGLTWSDLEVMLSSPGPVSGAQLLRKEQMVESIPTFSEALDRILGGGVQIDSILQVCGAPGSGKTQLLLQLCVNVQIPYSLGGLASESVFIDTESTFNVNRLKDIAAGACNHCNKIAKLHNLESELKSFTVDSILLGVHYIGIGNLLQLISAIQRLKELLASNRKIKLVVIDSFTFPFLKFTNNLERTKHINIIVQDLHNISAKYDIAVVLTNHLTTKIIKDRKILSPSLGESFSHRCPNILLLGTVDNCFSAAMYKSFKLPEHVTHYKICCEGIRDI